MTYRQVIDALRAQANPANVAGMARYGISPLDRRGRPAGVDGREVLASLAED